MFHFSFPIVYFAWSISHCQFPILHFLLATSHCPFSIFPFPLFISHVKFPVFLLSILHCLFPIVYLCISHFHKVLSIYPLLYMPDPLLPPEIKRRVSVMGEPGMGRHMEPGLGLAASSDSIISSKSRQ